MKLIVFGATGGIGRQVVEQALQAGHQVTVVVRKPATFSLQHTQLVIRQGDVLEPVDSVQPERIPYRSCQTLGLTTYQLKERLTGYLDMGVSNRFNLDHGDAEQRSSLRTHGILNWPHNLLSWQAGKSQVYLALLRL